MTVDLFSEAGRQPDQPARAVLPLIELGAYEALWDEPKATFKSFAEKFAAAPGALPSDFVPPTVAKEYGEAVYRELEEHIGRFGVRIHGAGE